MPHTYIYPNCVSMDASMNSFLRHIGTYVNFSAVLSLKIPVIHFFIATSLQLMRRKDVAKTAIINTHRTQYSYINVTGLLFVISAMINV